MGTPQWNLPLVHLILKQYTRFTRKYTPKYPRTLSWYSYPSREQEQSGMNSSDQWTVNSAEGNTWPDVRFFCRPVTAQVPAARLFFSSSFFARLRSTEIAFFTSEEMFSNGKGFFYFKKLLFTCVRFFHLCQLKEKETLLPFLEISLLSLFTFLLF